MAGSDLPHTESVYCYKDKKSDANKNPTENDEEDCKVAFIINMDSPAQTDDDTSSEPEAEQYEKFHNKLPPIITGGAGNRASLESFDNASLSSYLAFSTSVKQISVSLSLLVLAVLFNLTVLSVIHERVPETLPLPDVAFSLLPKIDWALDLSEYIIMFVTTVLLIMIAAHRYRSILIRRLAMILSILYVFRGICMAVTQLPVANPQYYCSPKLNISSEDFSYIQFTGIVLSRITNLSLGMGLSVNGRHSFCGDYIFSGHTLILVISYLFIVEYWLDNHRIMHSIYYRLLRYIFFLLIVIGVTGIVISRGHYMIDIILAYYISTRVFLLYHKACDDVHNQPDSIGSLSTPTSIVIHNNTAVSTQFQQQHHHHHAQETQASSSPTPSLSSLSHKNFNTIQRDRLASSVWWFALFKFVEADTIHYRIPIQNHFDLHHIIFKAWKKARA